MISSRHLRYLRPYLRKEVISAGYIKLGNIHIKIVKIMKWAEMARRKCKVRKENKIQNSIELKYRTMIL